MAQSNKEVVSQDVDTQPAEAASAPPRTSRMKLVVGIIVVLVISGVGIYFDLRDGDIDKSPEEQREEIEEIVAEVRTHMYVPEEELPLLATVVDAEALAGQQPFYRGVLDGDKVLIFVQTQRAIIYSPERDIIVNAGPVIANDAAQPTSEVSG